MGHALKIFSADGDVLASLSDKTRCVSAPSRRSPERDKAEGGYHMATTDIYIHDRITAVQAVTALHPHVIGRAATANASGRCVLWSSD